MLSKIENLTRKYLKFYLKDCKVIYNHRPDFLKNEETGKNFELDIFFPRLKVAVEVNGFTHELKKVKERDKFKREKCKENGITLFQIYHIGHLINLRVLFNDYFKRNRWNEEDFDIDFRSRVPNKLWNRISKYKPNKKWLGKAGYAISNKIRVEKYVDKQSAETDGVKRRREEKLKRKLISG